MATATFDMRGLVIGLDHDETEKLTGLGGAATAANIAGVFTAIGLTGPWVAVVAGAMAVHFAWEVAVIKASDRGSGVWLNVPPPVLIFAPGWSSPRPDTR